MSFERTLPSLCGPVCLGVLLLGCISFAICQQGAAPAVAPAAAPDSQPRIFITDSNSWETRGSAGGGGSQSGGGLFAHSAGGARPQTAEIIKTFSQRCPQVLVNNRLELADYIVELEHEGGKGLLMHKDKVAVFVRTSGDAIFSTSTLSVGGSVQDACAALTANWAAHAPELKAAAQAQANAAAVSAGPPAQAVALPAAASSSLTVEASVPNCDIEVDGNFTGSTPSSMALTPGKHRVVVKKTGFADWSRELTFTGGTIRVSAEMVAQ